MSGSQEAHGFEEGTERVHEHVNGIGNSGNLPNGRSSSTDTNGRHRLRVVVTGGSSGIGRSIVERFASAGHLVLFSYLRNVSGSEELCAQYPLVTRVRLDQGCVNSVSTFAQFVRTWAGTSGVDVLINNAALGSATVGAYVDVAQEGTSKSYGNGHSAAKEDIADAEDAVRRRRAAEDDALMRVNALGPLWVTEELLSCLRNAVSFPGGRGCASVIFIGSVGGGSNAVFPEYRPSDLMSKAAMTYLVKHLAAEYVRDDIDVMCVAPGATETEMFRQSTLSKIGNVPAFIDRMPKRQLIQPTEIADVVFWLATHSAARVFHGAVLDASFGLAVRPGLQTESDRR